MNMHLPPPLMTSEPGSFARLTIAERKPLIIRMLIDDGGYPPEILRALKAFHREITQEPVQLLTEAAPDVVSWNRQAAAYEGKTWLELPWYFAESYFFRRLLEAVGYFEPGPWQGHDPFGAQKREQGQAAVAWLASNQAQLDGARPQVVFETLLHSCLWGNRADLSNLTALEEVHGGLAARQEVHHILIDHTAEAENYLSAGLERVDLISDNAGRELLADLALSDFLLSQGWVRQVVFHLKDRPFFVSDAMPQDVQEMVSLLRTEPLGQRLDEHGAAGRLVLKNDPFWASGLMFRQMPPALTAALAGADLVILKGDLNYRRLLDDRHWPYTTRMEEITAYFPAPFLVLRTLKGEIMAGLAPGKAEEVAAQDPDWLVNGKRGIIQLVHKAD